VYSPDTTSSELPHRVVLGELAFPEAPRWHAGALWFSDMHAHEVLRTDLAGGRDRVVAVPGQPSGLGWLPDGRMLVVSMTDRQLMVFDGSTLECYADLGPWAGFHCNDMVVDAHGRAYVGNFGFDHYSGEPIRPAQLVRVDLDGSVRVVDDSTLFPNGLAITADGGTLITAETYGRKLTAWDVRQDGSLSRKHTFADLPATFPDGICVDADGAVWVADITGRQVLRVLEGGEITAAVSTGDRAAYACMLGDPDRRTLFICTALASGPASRELRSGCIEAVRVTVPGAGWP
jgi:sugar lactone lactonase YvrE